MTTQNAGKIYGQGDPSPLTTADMNGFYASDGITATFSRAAGEDVGNYGITTTLVDPNGKLGDYNVTDTGATFTISPATPTVTVTNASGTYTSLAFAAAGSVAGVNSVNLGTPAFTYYSGTYTTMASLSGLTALAGAPVDVGSYTIVASFAGSLDYTAASAVATFTISQKAVTVTTQNAGKTYGQGDPSPLTTADLSGFYASDGITATFSRAAGAAVGSYAITTTLVDPNGKLSDYNVTNAGATFTISPVVTAVFEGFESGNFRTWPWDLSSTGTAPANWTVQSSVVHAGSYAAQSGPIGASSSSTLSVTLTEAAGGEFSFWRSVSSASGSGLLSFAIDGTTANQWSGAVPWQQSFYYVSAGTHTFSWTYSKATGTPAGSDAAWLDDVLFTPGTTLTVDGTSASDQFGFATSGPTVIVALDGETHSFAPGEFTNYVFHGDGGTAILIGGTGTNSAMLYANGSGQLDNSTAGYAVAVDGMTSITAIGHAGDTAQFFDSPGNDAFYAYGDFNQSGQPLAEMLGAGYANVASGFGTNIANSSGGNDTAVFFDSPGNDTYDAYADYNNSGKPAASMSGSYGAPGTPGPVVFQYGQRFRHQRRLRDQRRQ